MWTTLEITSTGINMDTVTESKLKLHETSRDSLFSHLNNSKETGMLFNPTSKKAKTAKKVVIITQ